MTGGRTWFTADLHFGHANIVNLCQRPWDDVEAMNEGLIQRWNNWVGPNDTVWVLGDVSLTPNHLHHVRRLLGRKILVAGNHDLCWTGHRRIARAARARPRYIDAGFDEVYASGQLEYVVAGHRVRLSHLPYRADRTDRYVNRRPIDDGLPLLCGHVHDAWRVNGNQINVGVDVWGWAPVSEDDLEPLLDEMKSEALP